MSLVLAFALQAAAAASPGPASIDFDLARYRSSEAGPGRCERGADPDAILVCGIRRRDGDYPLDEMARLFAPRPILAETGLGGRATGRLFLDSATLPNGMVSNRVMVGIRVPF